MQVRRAAGCKAGAGGAKRQRLDSNDGAWDAWVGLGVGK